VDLADATAMLEHRWTDSMPKPWQTGPEWAEEWEWAAEMTAPFTIQYPGLAPAIATALPPKALEEALQKFPASRIALVPAARPADVLPVLGWIPASPSGTSGGIDSGFFTY
jgi:hypothetical protein